MIVWVSTPTVPEMTKYFLTIRPKIIINISVKIRDGSLHCDICKIFVGTVFVFFVHSTLGVSIASQVNSPLISL
jgi:hypothetical protein